VIFHDKAYASRLSRKALGLGLGGLVTKLTDMFNINIYLTQTLTLILTLILILILILTLIVGANTFDNRLLSKISRRRAQYHEHNDPEGNTRILIKLFPNHPNVTLAFIQNLNVLRTCNPESNPYTYVGLWTGGQGREKYGRRRIVCWSVR
jgi:hypothetical protein